MRYFIDGDGGGRYYMVPYSLSEAWDLWLSQLENMDIKTIVWDPPLGCVEIDDPRSVTFEDPKLDD